ncbi:hypothetical protein DYBT9275_00937 [Dyadobacter sp. CECT 9275]|uniref:Uncharacterized protein n=1 Tax=Dyadobacter helix TaxID=2822344 RepID=A0A916N2Y5_9BACT|nr:hypothetical protein DYBT9275_00937 [Dyadobacter sp. CECT 9275]
MIYFFAYYLVLCVLLLLWGSKVTSDPSSGEIISEEELLNL